MIIIIIIIVVVTRIIIITYLMNDEMYCFVLVFTKLTASPFDFQNGKGRSAI